jgi:hypothetical protein
MWLHDLLRHLASEDLINYRAADITGRGAAAEDKKTLIDPLKINNLNYHTSFLLG